MSKEIEAIQDPGLPAHKLRQTDIDPKAADRAERQVAILFLLSALSTVLFIFSYFFISTETFIFIPLMGEQNAHQLRHRHRVGAAPVAGAVRHDPVGAVHLDDVGGALLQR